MSAELEEELGHVLAGQNISHTCLDVVVPGQESYVPITKQTVCYIVCGVVFNEAGEVLMMQEAKSSCFGMWYLPAGRMESDETILEGVQREVLEETGIMFEPTTLLAVEVASGFWYRFTLTGKVTGGSLKTYEQRDKESLQAKWCSVELIKSGRKGFPLRRCCICLFRASDILPLIDTAITHRTALSCHPDLLPCIHPQTKLLMRFVFVNNSEDCLRVMVSQQGQTHLPVAVISSDDGSLQVAIFRALTHFFGELKFRPKIHGVLALEHSGRPAQKNDGICITVLISLPSQSEQPPKTLDPTLYHWLPATSADVWKTLQERTEPGHAVPLLLLR